MSRSPLLVIVTGAIILTTIAGCGQIRETLPSMERVVRDAKESASEPATWLPLATAAAIALTDTDNSISDWASDNTPIFGSQNKAGDRSDDLRNALVAGMALTSIFAPTAAADNAFPTRRVVANALAFSTIAGIVETGKRTVKRQRPNNRDTKSFPSGHSSGAFSSAILIERNLNATIEQPWLRKTIKIGAYGSAATVAWARVEAKEHHLVDVLFSAGLSNFLVKTFYSSIVSEEQAASLPIAIETNKQGFLVKINQSF